MAVYFEPYKQPWWTGILGALIQDQLGQMSERGKIARETQERRKFAEGFSNLLQQNPDMAPEELLAQGIGLPGFSQAGKMGEAAMAQAMESRKQKAARDALFSMGGAQGIDPRSAGILQALVHGAPLGIQPEQMMKLLSPELKQSMVDQGDKKTFMSVNPYTGEVVGAPQYFGVGVSPDVAHQTEAQRDIAKGRDAATIRAAQIRGPASTGAQPKDILYYDANTGDLIQVAPDGRRLNHGQKLLPSEYRGKKERLEHPPTDATTLEELYRQMETFRDEYGENSPMYQSAEDQYFEHRILQGGYAPEDISYMKANGIRPSEAYEGLMKKKKKK